MAKNIKGATRIVVEHDKVEEGPSAKRTSADRTVLDEVIERYREHPTKDVYVTPEGNLHVNIPKHDNTREWDYLHNCWVPKKSNHRSWDLRFTG